MKPLFLIAAAVIVSTAVGGVAVLAQTQQPAAQNGSAGPIEALRTYVMDLGGTERPFVKRAATTPVLPTSIVVRRPVE